MHILRKTWPYLQARLQPHPLNRRIKSVHKSRKKSGAAKLRFIVPIFRLHPLAFAKVDADLAARLVQQAHDPQALLVVDRRVAAARNQVR